MMSARRAGDSDEIDGGWRCGRVLEVGLASGGWVESRRGKGGMEKFGG